MGQLNDHQNRVPGSKPTLRDVFLVADELVLKGEASLPQPQAESKPGSYTVKIFCDETLITATELLYGKTSYLLTEIDSLQILKLHRKRSVIQKKLTNFIAGVIIAAGFVLLLSPVTWPVRLLDVCLIAASTVYVIYFNWWVEQRRRGEFGLIMTMRAGAKVAITSHSLKAIQALYQVMFSRLDGGNFSGESLVVNMYTGATVSRHEP
ncbi:hypothetical protein IQ260_23755 [Leptolyngbya cf. ectocarpi LEGE 11479]|uniref:Uncharacterized protein n=1 Tax=Leptolyngbya cf. ectocarpi LEGE 11479 TaxID=1828722 RepID=A0A929FA04_LEPEC|nr:hypothetical protein [Leptolyngbya ectocarpi]MBE9069666.1 hypothetical protein [Leptolyngbya cf. ectocarpi LEGE 11479]